jgi:hypothetical protein
MKADLKFIGNTRLNAPFWVVPGDTVTVAVRDSPYKPYRDLIKETVTETMHCDEVAIFKGMLEDGRRALGGMLIEDAR